MSAPVTESPNTSADLNSLLLAQLAPIATQAAATAVSSLRGELTALETNLEAEIAAHKADVEKQIAAAGTTIIAKAEADPWTPRIVVGAVLLGCLITLIAYYAGNAQAAKVIAGVPTAMGLLVALMVRLEGIPRPVQKGT